MDSSLYNPIEKNALYRKAMMFFIKLRVFCNLMTPHASNREEIEDEEGEYATEYEETPFTMEEKVGFFDTSPKIKAIYAKLVDLLPTVPYKRVIIFSSFVSTLDILESVVNSKNPDILTFQYTGKKRRDERNVIVDAFTNTEEERPMVLFATFGAASCGINLTPCSTLFLADITMNPFDELQASNRVHRLTQMNKVNVYKFYMKGMVEESILNMQKTKISNAKSIGLIMV